jgi:RsiW-degrading membrane proteinase PrsW (M82 family)
MSKKREISNLIINDYEPRIAKKKRNKKIFNNVTWSIFWIGVIFTFCLIFIWKMTFLHHIIFLTSLYFCVYLIMYINIKKIQRDGPTPYDRSRMDITL